jgi:hypothetical protein
MYILSYLAIFMLYIFFLNVGYGINSAWVTTDPRISPGNMWTGSTVLSYVNMVCASLRNSIPKSIVYCQVREAKRSLLDHFFTELGKLEVRMKVII